MSFLNADAARVRFVVTAILERYPELAEDEELRADMMEGETDLNAVISKAVRERAEDLALAEGLKGYIAELAERKQRLERRGEAKKELIKGLMDVADLDKLALPEATLFVTAPRVSVTVKDVNELPQGFYVVERKADKAAIKKSLEAGQPVPGAELEIGLAGLTIRTK